MTSPLLEIREVSKRFDYRGSTFGHKGQIVAVDKVSFSVEAGQTFSVVGESGSGKSTVGNLVLGLLEPTAGEVLFKGTSLARMSRPERRLYRRAVQAVFQDPFASLNPRMQIGQIVAEPLEVQGVPKRARISRVATLLEAVGVPPAEMKRYPHELSGGQRQRIGIARALALEPELIVLDEPVSALDVSIRSQILNLLADLQESLGVAYLLISHDLPSVQHMSHQVGVMYLGRLLEIGEANAVCTDPAHPYTASLIAAATPPPRVPPWPVQLIGEIPSTLSVPDGCLFNPRCPFAFDPCRTVSPVLLDVGPMQMAACHLYPDRIKEAKEGGVPSWATGEPIEAPIP